MCKLPSGKEKAKGKGKSSDSSRSGTHWAQFPARPGSIFFLDKNAAAAYIARDGKNAVNPSQEEEVMSAKWCKVNIQEPEGVVFGLTFLAPTEDEAMFHALRHYSVWTPQSYEPVEQEARDLEAALVELGKLADTMPEPWRVCTICKANGYLRPAHGSEVPHAAKTEWILKSEALSGEQIGVNL